MKNNREMCPTCMNWKLDSQTTCKDCKRKENLK